MTACSASRGPGLYALFGLAGLDPITHSLFWSMLVNLGLLIGCSILIPQSPLVRAQAVAFVEALRQTSGGTRSHGAAPRRSASSGRWSAAFSDLSEPPWSSQGSREGGASTRPR